MVASFRVSWTATARNATVNSGPAISQHVWRDARGPLIRQTYEGLPFVTSGARIVNWTLSEKAFEKEGTEQALVADTTMFERVHNEHNSWKDSVSL